jgi:DNA-binding beta-propeller fold protein YncE
VIASKRRWLLAFGLVGAVGISALVFLLLRWRPTVTMLEPPGRDSKAGITGDTAILVSGRRVTPVGRVLRVQSYNWGLALSPDESRAVLVNPSAFQLVDLREPFLTARIPPHGTEGSPDLGSGSYMGCTFSRDGRLLYYGSADAGQIKVFDLASGRVIDTIHLNSGTYADSFVGDFVLSADGSRLYAVDQFNYRLVVFDLKRDQVLRSVRVGRNPFAVALSPDGRYAWVSSVGMFEYPLLPGVTSRNRRKAGLSFPAYGVPSNEADKGTTAEGIEVPGLGSPNHPDAMSVLKVNLSTGAVEKRVKTGYLVGAERDAIRTIGGSSPGSVTVGRRFVYVANATNDNVSVVDAESGRIIQHIDLKIPGLETLRGVLPFGLALSPDESRLFVACAGLNAVAVIDLVDRRLEGYIPAGWFCSMVAVSRDGRTLYVASAKGLGSGPNGGQDFVTPDRGLHPADIMQGTLQVIAVPGRTGLDVYTRQVIDNTYWKHEVEDDPHSPVPPLPNKRQSPIRHIVFVVKENRTFDQVFGQRSGVDGDASATTLGLGMTVTSGDKTLSVSGVDVSPNHHALADRFAISDNFYCDSDQSNTGHRWVAGVYPNEWVEVNARSHIEERLLSSAPGRRYVAGSSAVVLPEDYNEAGALWEHLDRHGIPFFNFGFGTEMPASLEERAFKETGVRMAVSFPLPKPLFDHTSRKYPTYNMAIPDQYRMDMFEEELRARWLSGKEPFPRLITMVLPNDHLAKERPEDGYPFVESYMGDNDLALGRLVHTLSRTPYWKDMLVIVTEDDPQGGRDHVEAHRSLLMVIGPYVKRGYVSHTLASFGSIMRLIFTLLDLPPLNQFDATASLPLDFFAARPDLTPYTARAVDKRLFDPDAAFKPFDRRFNWKALAESPAIDDPDQMRAQFARPESALGAVTVGKK